MVRPTRLMMWQPTRWYFCRHEGMTTPSAG